MGRAGHAPRKPTCFIFLLATDGVLVQTWSNACKPWFGNKFKSDNFCPPALYFCHWQFVDQHSEAHCPCQIVFTRSLAVSLPKVWSRVPGIFCRVQLPDIVHVPCSLHEAFQSQVSTRKLTNSTVPSRSPFSQTHLLAFAYNSNQCLPL